MKLVRHRKILYGIIYMWSQKKIVNITKRKSHRELVATSVEKWVGLYRTRGLRSKNDYV